MPIINFDPFQFTDLTSFVLPLDIYRDGSNLVIEANLPNVDKDRLEVSIEDDVLTLQAQSEQKRELDEKNFYRKEVRRGAFYRSVPLPAPVVGEKAKANYENGVLKVVVPLAEEKKSKSIKIEVKK